ncbi:MAG: aminomethyl-transferring glycine dehydrogenase [Bacteroidetes bacterium]|jgi:glycine dehydrogenase|nr:aminomethyl-transferring glycine dehydrogenase [Bacteroidota bacterium]
MPLFKFINRHIGPNQDEVKEMLDKIGEESLDDLINKTIPESIRLDKPLNIPEGISEYDYFNEINKIAQKNKVNKSYIGLGYYNTVFPAVIQRNILENSTWYTSYTPYQAEISQGRLEALLNYQTVVTELTGMELANASLLDESTAAAEAMVMLYNARSRADVKAGKNKFFVDRDTFPQTIAVLESRAEPLGIELIIDDFESIQWHPDYFGVFIQYPSCNGEIKDYRSFVKKAHDNGCAVAVSADIMSLVLLSPPGEWGADVVVGSTQRFGIPMGYGGPHAAYFATLEKYKRHIPGRIIGLSVDKNGRRAFRMALQTREQHIKREKATSNICTAQALLATMAGMYAVYHGPEGLKSIARHIHSCTVMLNQKINELGYEQVNKHFFDTLEIKLPEDISNRDIQILALERDINLRYINDRLIGVSLDETVNLGDLNKLIEVFSHAKKYPVKTVYELQSQSALPLELERTSNFMEHELFNKYRTETELMRYIKKLEKKDFSLTHSMISLGSCTMKLNAAIELLPLSWPAFGEIHPFAPIDQTEGYQQIFYELGKYLRSITGFEAISFQPNSGASGEYTGLMVIREYFKSKEETHRKVVLIPSSAHGTNPASAVMAGFKVVVVNCDKNGNIDTENLKAKAEENKDTLAALMVTYPSTHGVFEPNIKEIIDIVHNYGGQVYMDGANMNAQVGLTNPAAIGADVCHLNLHKTFAIPHGGGGPGMGPIGVAEHLVQFLPSHPLVSTGGIQGISAISSAPWGSASILTISHAYIRLLGADGLRKSTEIAILNANYLASCLKNQIQILYKGINGHVAHEMILDCRPFKGLANITELDIAKRLMDYGFHAPTLSFPVVGTLMVEPTESESLDELNRFVEAMQSIYQEIMQIEKEGNYENNILKNAPHTTHDLVVKEWKYNYSQKQAVFPFDWVEENKLWPAINRIDDAYGDRNLVCSCIGIENYA